MVAGHAGKPAMSSMPCNDTIVACKKARSIPQRLSLAFERGLLLSISAMQSAVTVVRSSELHISKGVVIIRGVLDVKSASTSCVVMASRSSAMKRCLSSRAVDARFVVRTLREQVAEHVSVLIMIIVVVQAVSRAVSVFAGFFADRAISHLGILSGWTSGWWRTTEANALERGLSCTY